MKLSRKVLALAVVGGAMAANADQVPVSKGVVHTPTKQGPDIPPMYVGRDALRQLVQNQCLVNWRLHHDPSPCESINLAGPQPDSPGYAVLEDPQGGAHYLVVPLQTLSGTDSSELLDPDLPNYFADAWGARTLLSKFVGHAVPRTAVGLAINTARARDQNQFNIHVECLRPEVFDALRAAAPRLSDQWTQVALMGTAYQALRIADSSLAATNPFELLAHLSPEARHHIEAYTVLIAGMQYSDGAGFVMLTSTGPTAELLLDPGCSVAGGGS